jgi:hypothetical protein
MTNTDQPIDKLLSAFYKAEMPKQWPALDLQTADIHSGMPVPASLCATVPAHEVVTPNKSRMALAVSAALILGGLWYLSDRFDHHASQPGIQVGTGSASSKTLMKYAEPKAKVEEVPSMP